MTLQSQATKYGASAPVQEYQDTNYYTPANGNDSEALVTLTEQSFSIRDYSANKELIKKQ